MGFTPIDTGYTAKKCRQKYRYRFLRYFPRHYRITNAAWGASRAPKSGPRNGRTLNPQNSLVNATKVSKYTSINFVSRRLGNLVFINTFLQRLTRLISYSFPFHHAVTL